ncbi:MAG: holin-like protein [Methylobacteriaceae bacterium]|jgi:holin-like protein|nr:holin-like protein [Methylobacteriaceae bacterium]
MIESLVILLFCQLLGEALVHALTLPLPGPVAGMMLLFLALLWRGRKAPGEPQVPEALADTSDALLRNLSLLFIPAAVGIIQHTGILRESGLAIAVSIVVSTVLAMAVTALVFERLGRLLHRNDDLPRADAP